MEVENEDGYETRAATGLEIAAAHRIVRTSVANARNAKAVSSGKGGTVGARFCMSVWGRQDDEDGRHADRDGNQVERYRRDERTGAPLAACQGVQAVFVGILLTLHRRLHIHAHARRPSQRPSRAAHKVLRGCWVMPQPRLFAPTRRLDLPKLCND